MMGEVLALRVESIMKLDPHPNDTAITPSLLEQLNTSLYRFLATNPKALDHDKRHKGRQLLTPPIQKTSMKVVLQFRYPKQKAAASISMHTIQQEMIMLLKIFNYFVDRQISGAQSG